MSGFIPFDPNSSGVVGSSTFDELTDTPESKTGQAGKVLVVNGAENALVYENSGGSSLPTFTPPESPFADNTARDLWANANLNLLYNGDANFSYTLLEVGGLTQRWGGDNQPASYSSSFWIDASGGSAIWGSIGGNINDQADLSAVAKTNEYEDLSNKPNIYLVNPLSFGFNDVSLYSTKGTPAQQNWTEQLLATITTQSDSVFGRVRDVYDYVALGGGVGLNTAVTINDVQDLIDNGAEFGGVMKGLITATYQSTPTYSNFSFDVQSSLNPLGDPQGYRMIIFLQEIGGFYNILIDSDAGNINHLTTITAGDWLDVRLKVLENPTATTLTDMRANLIVNGEVVLTDLNIFQGQGASTRTGCFHQVWLVGQQIRLSEFGITIYTDSSTMTLSNVDFAGFKETVVAIPKGNREYDIEFAADIAGRDIGDKFIVNALNVGGRFNLINLGTPPTVLFDGLNNISLGVSSVSVFTAINTEGANNTWSLALPNFHRVRGFTYFEPSADSIGFGVEEDDGTGAKIQVLGGISVDGVLIPKPEFFEVHGGDGDFQLPEGASKIEVEVGTGVITITLPPNPTNGFEVLFYSAGDVANNNIHFISGTAATVDGDAIRVFNKDKALCTFIFLHDDWEVFHEHGRSVSTATFIVSKGLNTQPLAIHDGLSGTETVLDFGTASDGIFDIASGMIEVLVDIDKAQVITEIHVSKVSGGSDSEYSSWAEVSTDSGSNWSIVGESLRRDIMSKDGGTVIISELSLGDPVVAGTLFRVIATNTAASAISVLAPSDITGANGTVTGFATKISIRTT